LNIGRKEKINVHAPAEIEFILRQIEFGFSVAPSGDRFLQDDRVVDKTLERQPVFDRPPQLWPYHRQFACDVHLGDPVEAVAHIE
jgi:hypothetical protein